MNSSDRQLLSALNDVVKQLLQGRKGIRLEPIAESSIPEINDLSDSISALTKQYNQSYDFILDMAKGKLETAPPPLNSFVTPFKQLHADLQHLTWQIQQISEGDLEQKVSFSGDFSDSINRMIESLREKQRISELNERYLSELTELNASKDKLFSIIAHDLKNPFSGLMNLSDMIVSEVKTQKFENVEQYATLLQAFSLQGYKLLINLLDWAKVQSNSILITLEPLQLQTILKETLEMIEPAAIQKNIALSFLIPEDLTLIADSKMLQTVIRNLLSNAVKFTPKGGMIILSAEKTGDKVMICVKDNGVGIRPESMKNLFHINSAFSTNGTNNEMGTGLGLILCNDYLKKMNSEIQLESELGKGTTFSFSLPLA